MESTQQCSRWLYCCCEKLHCQSNSGRKVFIWLLPSCPNPLLREIRARTQGRNLEVGTMKGAAGWLILQGCSANFLVQYRATCSENGVSCNRLGPPITINQDSCPQTWPQASLFWLIAQDPLILGNSWLYHFEIKKLLG